MQEGASQCRQSDGIPKLHSPPGQFHAALHGGRHALSLTFRTQDPSKTHEPRFAAIDLWYGSPVERAARLSLVYYLIRPIDSSHKAARPFCASVPLMSKCCPIRQDNPDVCGHPTVFNNIALLAALARRARPSPAYTRTSMGRPSAKNALPERPR